MLLAILIVCFSTVSKESLAWPMGSWGDTAMGYDITTDFLDAGYGPWSPDYLRGSRWMPQHMRSMWPYDRYGFGDPYDLMNPLAQAPDYFGGLGFYPRATDVVAKEKYIKDYPYGETEVGIRDSVSMRPGFGRPRNPYASPPFYGPRAYGGYYDLQPFMPYRRMFAAGLGSPRPSSLRTGGDFMYMRR